MKYDDASWHSGGSFPEDAPEEYGGTHIALFLRWCFTEGWAGEIHLTEEPVETQRVIDGTLPATDFLFKYCDGKLTSEELNEAGNAFAREYYGDDGLYLDDYAENFGELMYSAPEQEHDFATFVAVLAQRNQSGVLTKRGARRSPWWKFW